MKNKLVKSQISLMKMSCYFIFLIFYLLKPDLVFAQQNNISGNSSGENISTTEHVKEQVESDVQNRIDEKRKLIIQEAVTAVEETKRALDLLNQDNPSEALKALENATGKLDIILARDPKLALAPVYMTVLIQDLIGLPQEIKKVIRQAKYALVTDDIQKARSLICPIGSELVIQVTSIPLATYPQAIREIASFIDKGQIKLAKTHLNVVLNTLVITRYVIPLPYIKAYEMLKLAQAENESQDKNIKNVAAIALIQAARDQIEMAITLGYGKRSELKPIINLLDKIKTKIDKGESADDLFGQAESLLLNTLNKNA